MNGVIFSTTKVPRPGWVTTRPRVVSHLIASRTVFRDALSYCSRSSNSVGSSRARCELAGLDPPVQVIGYLPVERVRHGSSSSALCRGQRYRTALLS